MQAPAPHLAGAFVFWRGRIKSKFVWNFTTHLEFAIGPLRGESKIKSVDLESKSPQDDRQAPDNTVYNIPPPFFSFISTEFLQVSVPVFSAGVTDGVCIRAGKKELTPPRHQDRQKIPKRG